MNCSNVFAPTPSRSRLLLKPPQEGTNSHGIQVQPSLQREIRAPAPVEFADKLEKVQLRGQPTPPPPGQKPKCNTQLRRPARSRASASGQSEPASHGWGGQVDESRDCGERERGGGGGRGVDGSPACGGRPRKTPPWRRRRRRRPTGRGARGISVGELELGCCRCWISPLSGKEGRESERVSRTQRRGEDETGGVVSWSVGRRRRRWTSREQFGCRTGELGREVPNSGPHRLAY